MNREDCWMSFSDALEYYLDAKERAEHYGAGANRDIALADMQIAKDHMDALTQGRTP